MMWQCTVNKGVFVFRWCYSDVQTRLKELEPTSAASQSFINTTISWKGDTSSSKLSISIDNVQNVNPRILLIHHVSRLSNHKTWARPEGQFQNQIDLRLSFQIHEMPTTTTKSRVDATPLRIDLQSWRSEADQQHIVQTEQPSLLTISRPMSIYWQLTFGDCAACQRPTQHLAAVGRLPQNSHTDLSSFATDSTKA